MENLEKRKCVICGKEYVLNEEKEIVNLGNSLSVLYNNKLSICYPHVFYHCPNCAMVDVPIKDDMVSLIKLKKADLEQIMEQELNFIDIHGFARRAECRGYICELIGDVSGATLAYKACLDIMEARLKEFENKYIKHVETKKHGADVLAFPAFEDEGEIDQNLFDDDVDIDNVAEQYSYAKAYVQTMQELVSSVSAKSFEVLGYLGVLIHLDTIVNLDNFSTADKMFALLNDKSTVIPNSLIDAKEQIEDRYIVKRKKALSKK